MRDMTDKELLRKRFAGATGSYDSEAVAQKAIAGNLALMAAVTVPAAFRDRIMEIGCGTGLLTRAMTADFVPDVLYLNDICPEFGRLFEDLGYVELIPGDAEQVPFPNGLGMIVSSSALQWFDDLEGFFGKCRTSLRDGGYLVFSTFGPGNLREVTALTGKGLRYPSLARLKEMLGPGFEVMSAAEAEMSLYFRSPLEVLRHLKRTGVNGLERRSWTRGDLDLFCRSYEECFRSDAGCRLTYHPVYVAARKLPGIHSLSDTVPGRESNTLSD